MNGMDEMDISSAFDNFLDTRFADTGLTTREHLRTMAKRFKINGWDTCQIHPIVGYYGKPLLLGAWLTSGERSISAELPFPTLPEGLQKWLEKEWEDSQDESEVAITMLLSRRALIATGADLDYAEKHGWTAVLQQVWDARRPSNFEGFEHSEAVNDMNENVPEAVRLLSGIFGDLLSAMNENVFIIEDGEDAEFDDEFQSEWA